MQSLYVGSHSDVIFAGPTKRAFCKDARLRIPLGYFFGPVVRVLTAAHPEPRGSLIAFAPDLAAACLNVVSGLVPLLEVFLLLPMAVELHLHIPKVTIVSYSECSDFDLKRRLHERIGSSALVVKHLARYLRVSIGLAASESFWEAASGRCLHRRAAL